MKAPPLTLICLLLVSWAIVAGSCAHNPKSTSESRNIIQERSEYVLAHPDGEYNSYILNGEIVKGMGPTEVLVSWGIPNRRQYSDNDTYIFWTYFEANKQSGEITQYVLVFKQQELYRWKIILGPPDGGFNTRDPNLPVTLGQIEKENTSNVLRK
jgi:hypothetical protein